MLSEEKEKEFEQKLKMLAEADFSKFCQFAKVDKTQAFVCMERTRGKSYQQIAIVLGITRESVYQRAQRCNC